MIGKIQIKILITKYKFFKMIAIREFGKIGRFAKLKY